MAGGQQDIVLNMVAELDQGTVQSDAAQMASTISRTIEQAFEGLGQKIAENIMKGIQGGVQSAAGLVDPTGAPIGQGPPPIPGAPPVPGGAAGAAVAAPQAQGQFRGGFQHPGYLDVHAQPLQAISTIRQQIQQDILGGGGSGGGTSYEGDPASLRGDVAFQRARQIQQMRRAGVEVNLTGEERETFEGARETGRASLLQGREQSQKLAQELENLNKNIIALQREMNESVKMSQEDRAARGVREPAQIKQHQDEERLRMARSQMDLGQLTGAMGVAGERMGALGGALAGPSKMPFMSTYGQVMGLAATGAMVAGQLPGAFRRGAVGGAAIENLQARAAMGGDVERLMAVGQLGGMDSLETGGTMEAALGIGGRLAGAGIAAAAGPVTGGAGYLAAGVLGTQAVGQIAQFDAERQRVINERIAAQISQQQEFFQFTKSGRQQAVSAFRSAQAMGAPEFSEFMAGIGMDISGGTMRQAAVAAGISEPQFRQTLGGLAGGMGGMFFGEQPRLQGMPGGVRDVMRMQGLGLQQAPGILSQMQLGVGGNQMGNRQENMEQLRSMFEDAVSAGLDRARTGQALQIMANQAQQGLGATGAAVSQFQQSLGIAQNLFGAGGIEGAEMGFTQRAMAGIQGFTRGGGGLGQIAGLRAARQFAGEAGMEGLGPLQMLNLQQQMQTPGSIARLMRQQGAEGFEGEGTDFSPGQMQRAQGLMGRFQTIRRQQAGAVAEEAFGGMAGAREFVFGGMAGTAEEAMGIADITRAGDIRAETGRQVTAAGQITGPAFDISQQNAAKAAGALGQIAQQLSQIDAETIANGFRTVGQQLPVLSEALSDLITRAETVLQEQGVAPGNSVEQRFQEILKNRTTMESTNRNNKARAPK